MTDPVMVEAVRRAIEGGLTGYWKDRYEQCVELGELEYLCNDNDENDPTLLMFSHYFAKALFGEEPHYLCGREMADLWGNGDSMLDQDQIVYDLPEWKYHLQQLAISEDRIDYLRQYLMEPNECPTANY